MASWDDVRRIALELPETTERTSHGPLRPADIRALGDGVPTGPILGARVEHVVAKEALLATDPDLFFTTPHFDGYPAVLVRLDQISVEDLEEVIVEAWLARAPKRLAQGWQR
jgi:hypothetical protein